MNADADTIEPGADPIAPKLPLAERMAAELAEARDEIAAAHIAFGNATTKEDRLAVERSLIAAALPLAWLHALATAEVERALSAFAAAGGFTEAAKRVRKAIDVEREAVVMPICRSEQVRDTARRDEAMARLTDADAAAAVRRLDGACIPTGLCIPYGYEVDHKGVRTVKVDEAGNVKTGAVCARPIFVTGRLVDPDDIAGELVVLRWYNGQGWKGRVVPRSQVCQQRELGALSAFGVPVGSSTAAGVSEWLEAFLVHNEPKLPAARAITAMGWRDLHTQSPAFVIGPEVIRRGVSVPSQLDDSDPTTWPKHALHLRTEDAATLAICRAWRTGGTWEGWLEVANNAVHHAALGLALRAALAPIVLRLVGAANFVFDIAGITSQGKSTALYFAASALGFPDDKQQGIVRPWNATRVGIERVSAFCADLPLFLDDTRQLGKKQVEEVASVVYMVVNGQGRGRGTVTGGVANSSSWHTVMLSTGETPITDLTQAGGAAARTITLFGSPLGDTKQEKVAREIRDGSFAHYGHVARRMIAWLQEKGNVAKVRDWYKAEGETMAKDASDSEEGRAVLSRAGDYVATLAVVGRILGEIGVPAWKVDPQAMAKRALLGTVARADRPTEALGVVYAWCCERQEAFWGRHRQVNGEVAVPPGAKWAGAWSERVGWEWIGINEATLRETLRAKGFDVEATLQTWAARGWTLDQSEKRKDKIIKRPTIVAKVSGAAVRCVGIKRSALDEAGCVSGPVEVDGMAEEVKPAAKSKRDDPPPPSDADRVPFGADDVPY